MSGNLAIWRKEGGRDTSYRTSNLDTHLTHGCIQLFRHFSRVRLECAAETDTKNRATPVFFESALRTRMASGL